MLFFALGQVLEREAISAPLMIVKGDGTLMKADVALEYPVETVLSGPAVDRIKSSKLEELVVTNSIPLKAEAAACGKIRRLSVAPLLGRAIQSIHEGGSVSTLFV